MLSFLDIVKILKPNIACYIVKILKPNIACYIYRHPDFTELNTLNFQNLFKKYTFGNKNKFSCILSTNLFSCIALRKIFLSDTFISIKSKSVQYILC